MTEGWLKLLGRAQRMLAAHTDQESRVFDLKGLSRRCISSRRRQRMKGNAFDLCMLSALLVEGIEAEILKR